MNALPMDLYIVVTIEFRVQKLSFWAQAELAHSKVLFSQECLPKFAGHA
jgi:hypothetical protein